MLDEHVQNLTLPNDVWEQGEAFQVCRDWLAQNSNISIRRNPCLSISAAAFNQNSFMLNTVIPGVTDGMLPSVYLGLLLCFWFVCCQPISYKTESWLLSPSLSLRVCAPCSRLPDLHECCRYMQVCYFLCASLLFVCKVLYVRWSFVNCLWISEPFNCFWECLYRHFGPGWLFCWPRPRMLALLGLHHQSVWW